AFVLSVAPQFTQRDLRLWTIGKAPAPADGPLRLSRAPSAASNLGRSHADIPMVWLAFCELPVGIDIKTACGPFAERWER
ncbi:hypothetical protein ACEQ6C_40135, partial [Rhizobium ruizarguesonis]